ncbi:DUF3797 domain-containing protein [Lysinibacillus sp. UGB7]|uniref:DUF3797 domain-containing protein n=1 Tax=Lysinibacillus sp. UGB7 TaxID=3411039 RepID=UPI003B7A1282
MDARDYVAVAKFINDCPNCGSSNVREGEGLIGMLDPFIKRTCKCGFNFKYDVDQGTKPKQIRQAIDQALSEC